MMENKVESPDCQMDISEAGTATADNISTSSVSPTISNQANESEISNGINTIVEAVTNNLNSIQLTTSSMTDSRHNRNLLTLDTNPQQQQHLTQKLTPVHHHPLMIDDESELKESCNNANISNFPDVVLAHHQPLRIPGQPAAKNQLTADLVNSVNNNNATKIRKPIYREPSPVS